MALSVLSQASALNPGSDLWILPDAGNSRWTVKIDWYLNFQICKAERHHSRALPEYVAEVLSETGLERPVLRYASHAPLLIPSQNLLPNKWIAILPLHKSYSQWVADIAQSWESLQNPSLRVFLPPGQNAGSFHGLWQSHHKFEDFTVVLD